MNTEMHEKGWQKISPGGIQGYFQLWFNILSFGCLSQLLYYDLLDNVDYLTLKRKLISLLIIWIRLMDEHLVVARQAVKKKSYYLPLLITANQGHHNTQPNI